MVDRSRIYTEIETECQRQDNKWGPQREHSPFIWLTILGEEVGEANQAALDAYFGINFEKWKHFREEVIHVAAVSTAILEYLNRNPFPIMNSSGEKG